MPRFDRIRTTATGFEGREEVGLDSTVRFSASFPLFLIREAWGRGASFEDLADGFGAGLGTMGGDWSGIRDSSPAARDRMLERALNVLFGRGFDDGRGPV